MYNCLFIFMHICLNINFTATKRFEKKKNGFAHYKEEFRILWLRPEIYICILMQGILVNILACDRQIYVI